MFTFYDIETIVVFPNFSHVNYGRAFAPYQVKVV